MAASLTRFSRSAPEKPIVCAATVWRSTSGASGLPLVCTARIASRPLKSARSSTTRRSKRPGRSKAGSRMSGRLVAAIMITFVWLSKPSISTKIWLSVCSRSSCEPPSPAPRWRPTASISSMNIMQGALRLAWSNRSRTRDAPTPTNISTNSDPEMEKNGTPASPATARAISVLPAPGGPTSSTPLGMRAPSAANFSGSLRNSTTSCNSVLASSTPATSAKVTVGLSPVKTRARLLPKSIAWLLLLCACRIMNNRKPPNITRGRNDPRIVIQFPQSLGFWTSIVTPLRSSWVNPRFFNDSTSPTRGSLREVSSVAGEPCRLMIVRSSPCTMIFETSPCLISVATLFNGTSACVGRGKAKLKTRAAMAIRMRK